VRLGYTCLRTLSTYAFRFAMTSDDAGRDRISLLNGQSAMAHALDGLAERPQLRSDGSWTPEGSSDMSDADGATQLRLPHRVPSIGHPSQSTTAVPSDEGHVDTTRDREQSRSSDGKRKTGISPAGGKSTHSLTTEDLQEIMRSGMQREIEKANGKSQSRPRSLVFTRQFTTFDRQNPSASQSPFHGFFTLFWIAMALLLVKIAAWNYKMQGSVFGNAEILHLMVDRDLFVLLATDGAMCAASSFGLFLHKAIAKGYLTWNGSGWVIQSLWQAFFTGFIIFWPFLRDWPWTHTVFIVLHVFVLLMKQHAYSFYNGYRKLLSRQGAIQLTAL
jgi:sterol O-acyltransferase